MDKLTMRVLGRIQCGLSYKDSAKYTRLLTMSPPGLLGWKRGIYLFLWMTNRMFSTFLVGLVLIHMSKRSFVLPTRRDWEVGSWAPAGSPLFRMTVFQCFPFLIQRTFEHFPLVENSWNASCFNYSSWSNVDHSVVFGLLWLICS